MKPGFFLYVYPNGEAVSAAAEDFLWVCLVRFPWRSVATKFEIIPLCSLWQKTILKCRNQNLNQCF